VKNDPLGKTTFAYDAVGNLTGVNYPTTQSTSFAYDSLNRLTTETWFTSGSKTNTLTYLYDAAGNITLAQNNAGTYTLIYDADNRVTVAQEPNSQALTLSYDSVGNRTQVQDSFGGLTTSVFDADNRLNSRKFTGNGQALRIDPGYQPNSLLSTLTRYNAVAGLTTEIVGTTSYLYDASNRLTAITDYSSTGSTLMSYTYAYDAGDRLTSEVDEGKSVTYAYDNANQLTAAGGTVYSYDSAGNRNSTGYSTGSDNELKNDGTWTYTYDNRGNITGKSDAAGHVWTYTYDNNNELTSATEGGGGASVQATYTYDAFGNRIEYNVTQGGVTTATFDAYDGWNPAMGNGNFQVWAESTTGNALTARYVRGDAVNQLFAQMASSGSPSWFLTDHLGSVVGETSSTGTLQLTMVYDAFGKQTSSTTISGSPMPVSFTWDGYQFDNATGLYKDGQRFYNFAIGRFVSQDPLGFGAKDPNLYRYVGNSPTNATDPSGLEEHHIIFRALYEATAAHPLPFSQEAIAVFRALGGPNIINAPGHHGASGGHFAYNAAVREETIRWMAENEITAATMTEGQARQLIQHIRNSPIPAIKDFFTRILTRVTGAAGAGGATAANAAGRSAANTVAGRGGSTWFRTFAKYAFGPLSAAIQEVFLNPTPTAGIAQLTENTLMMPPGSPDIYTLPLGTIILPTGEIYIPSVSSTYVPPQGSMVVVGRVVGNGLRPGQPLTADQVAPYVSDNEDDD
jgi:RHS repeat-associated protein